MENQVHFVENPNLPKGKVRLILIGKTYISRLDLEKWGIETIGLPEYEDLEKVVSAHADMQVVHLYSNQFMSNDSIYCKVKNLYNKYRRNRMCKVESLDVNFHVGARSNLQIYPESASYNVLLLDQFAIYNPKCVDPLLEYRLKQRYSVIPVYQGYARCSVCVVTERAVITADVGIANALRNVDIDVLEITPGHIALPGYDYGFIGGAAFKIDADKLAFTGTLDLHPDRKCILDFLEKHQVEPVYLSKEAIFDIGSAIPIWEE